MSLWGDPMIVTRITNDWLSLLKVNQILDLINVGNAKISDLKRQIEKEFSELFPYEPPYVVAKLDDEFGYSLSNGSKIGEFLKFGDRIVAQPENLNNEGVNTQIHGG